MQIPSHLCFCSFINIQVFFVFAFACWELSSQREATLIAVLESNLGYVQNGSLYQRGGSLPCSQSGGSRNSSSGVFLMTVQKEQLDNHLLQRLTEYWGRTKKEKKKQIYVFTTLQNLIHHMRSYNQNPFYRQPRLLVFKWLMSFCEE